MLHELAVLIVYLYPRPLIMLYLIATREELQVFTAGFITEFMVFIPMLIVRGESCVHKTLKSYTLRMRHTFMRYLIFTCMQTRGGSSQEKGGWPGGNKVRKHLNFVRIALSKGKCYYRNDSCGNSLCLKIQLK